MNTLRIEHIPANRGKLAPADEFETVLGWLRAIPDGTPMWVTHITEEGERAGLARVEVVREAVAKKFAIRNCLDERAVIADRLRRYVG